MELTLRSVIIGVLGALKEFLNANPDRTFGLVGGAVGKRYNDQALPVIETLVVNHNEHKLTESFVRALSLQSA
jgi:hypothetical protein